MAEVAGNYISESDILNWPDGKTDADKLLAINLAEQLIEKITHDYFYEADFNISLDGNDKDRLYLGLIPDVLSVTSVKISGITLNTDSYTNDESFIYIDNDAVLDAELKWLKGQSTGLFPKGIKNINIVGTYGHETCPEAIKQAAIIMVRRENDPTLYTMEIQGSESIGDHSYENPNRMYTGIREADRLLKLYIRKKPMMAVV